MSKARKLVLSSGSEDESDSEMEVEKEEKKENETISNEEVANKYRSAAEVANAALKFAATLVKPGVQVDEISKQVDAFITQETTKLFAKAKFERGIAFPTAVSTNHIVGHFAPLAGESIALNENDLVKIDLGVHFDGYAAVVAQTLVANNGAPVKGRQADVLAATEAAAAAAASLLKPGNTNEQISQAIEKVAKEFGVNPVQGVLSHSITRFELDGEKVIQNRLDAEQKVDKVTFEPNEVYAIDVVLSTGEGKPRTSNYRTTIYRRAPDVNYNLKMKASRATLNEINQKFPKFPFNIRALDSVEPKKVLFGIVECANHELVYPYPVLIERDGDLVAHVKFTALVQANATKRITGVPNSFEVHSEHSIKDEELKGLVAAGGLAQAKKKKSKKKGKKPASDKADGMEVEE